jgi:hypothetical protein
MKVFSTHPAARSDGGWCCSSTSASADRPASESAGRDHQRCQGSASLGPVLQRYGIGLYQVSLNAIQLSKDLVRRWLETCLLHGSSNASTVAQQVVDCLRDHNAFRSHGRRVSLFDLQARGVKVAAIRTDPRTLGICRGSLGMFLLAKIHRWNRRQLYHAYKVTT